MKTKAIFGMSLLLGALCLTSCGEENYPVEDYQQSFSAFDPLNPSDTVRVVQLTDLHFGYSEDYDACYAYLDELLGRTNPDFVMTTGDNVLIGNKTCVDELISIMDTLGEKYGFYWGTTWGNHDKQGLYAPTYWEEQFASAKRCIYKELNDKIYGLSNYVWNLTDGTSTKWQVYAIDTNILYQRNMAAYDYDVVHDDQIEWYKAEAEDAKTKNGGKYVPSLVFGHIPVWELEYAYRLAGDQNGGVDSEGTGRPGTNDAPGYLGRSSGYMRETDWTLEGLGTTRVYAGYKRTSLFVEGEKRAMKGIFFGHDHKNDFCAEYKTDANTQGYVTIGYGVKSNDGLTYCPDMLGCNVCDLCADGTVTYKRCFLEKNGVYGAQAKYLEEDMFQ